MAKSKKKKQDFQKVKLKVGRRLKKADNVTNASFRTRSVLISQKLKVAGEQPSTRKHLNISDLLSQFQHYNGSVRLDAVTGLQELMTSHPELLRTSISLVLERSSELFTDKDAHVRQAVIKLFKIIFPQIPSKQIHPFFSVISAYLCCAMTHIQEDIQSDSLLVFDLLLQNFADCVVNNSSQLLPNFIEQISRQNHSKRNSKERSLVIDPGGKTSPQKWWSRVLSRVQTLLSAILDSRRDGSLSDSKKNVDDRGTSVQVVGDLPTNFQPFPMMFQNGWLENLGGLTVRSDKVEISGATGGGTKENQYLVDLTQTLMPLLMQCWVESRTSQQHSDSAGSILSQDSLAVMVNILNVIQLLWECVENFGSDKRESAFSGYLEDFQLHFLQTFPYSVKTGIYAKKRKLNKKPQVQITAEVLNLAVCDVMTCFLQFPEVEVEFMPMISEYLLSFLQKKTDSQQTHTLLKILKRLFLRNSDSEFFIPLLQQAMNRYKAVHPLSAEKKWFLKFLAETLLEADFYFTGIDDLVEDFLINLCILLPRVAKEKSGMTDLVLSIIKRAVSEKCQPLMDSLQNSMYSLLDPQGEVIINVSPSSQRSVIELLYNLPKVTRPLLKVSSDLCFCLKVPLENVLYMINVLKCRFQKSYSTSAETAALYLSFLLTVLTGKKSSDADTSTTNSNYTSISKFNIKVDFSIEEIERHSAVSERICQTVQEMPNTCQTKELILGFIERYLHDKQSASLMTVCGILVLISRLEVDPYLHAEEGSPQPLIEMCFSVVCEMVALETADELNHLEQFFPMIVTKVTECILSISTGIQKFLTTIVNKIKICSTEKLGILVRVTKRVLEDRDVKNTIRRTGCQSIINTLSLEIQTRVTGTPTDIEWWEDFCHVMLLGQS